MKKLKITGVVFAAIVIFVLAMGRALPSEVVVTRDTVINAPPASVYPHLDSPKALLKWSPWADRDPDASWTFEGPPSGVGAKYSWSGNKEVGTGSQEITRVVPNERVETALDFGEQGPAKACFDLEPQGQETKVTWGLETKIDGPIGGWIALMFEGLIGPEYEEGLASLKSLVEGQAAAN